MQQINFSKKILVVYWLSILIALFFYTDTKLGYYHVIGGSILVLIHLAEIVFFNKIITSLSENVNKDRLLMIPFGILIITELKINAEKK